MLKTKQPKPRRGKGGNGEEVNQTIIVRTEIHFLGNAKDVRLTGRVYHLDQDGNEVHHEDIIVNKDYDNLPSPLKTVISNLYDKADNVILNEIVDRYGYDANDFKLIPHEKVNKTSKDEEKD